MATIFCGRANCGCIGWGRRTIYLLNSAQVNITDPWNTQKRNIIDRICFQHRFHTAMSTWDWMVVWLLHHWPIEFISPLRRRWASIWAVHHLDRLVSVPSHPHNELSILITSIVGTGKTETTKDLAKAMGLLCLVTNCGEGMDFRYVGYILSGLAQCGAWGDWIKFCKNKTHTKILLLFYLKDASMNLTELKYRCWALCLLNYRPFAMPSWTKPKCFW